jgi:kanosamine 6-kinase
VGGTKVALRLEGAGDGADDGAGDGDGAVAGAGAAPEAGFRWEPSATPAEDLAALAANVATLRARWGGPVAAVGVAMPATLDAGGRVVTWPGRPSWVGLDLAVALREIFADAQVSFADDGDLAALAEADHARCADLLYLGVGTGIGGGIVLDGRSCPGPARGSCEVGHLVIDMGGARCDCGRRGCVQAVASGPATLRRAAERRGGEVTFTELRDAWVDGAPWALACVRESATALAVAVVGLTELLHPSLAVVGGGFADGMPGFVEAVADHADSLARPGHPTAPVRAAGLGGLSSLYGAVLLARSL